MHPRTGGARAWLRRWPDSGLEDHPRSCAFLPSLCHVTPLARQPGACPDSRLSRPAATPVAYLRFAVAASAPYDLHNPAHKPRPWRQCKTTQASPYVSFGHIGVGGFGSNPVALADPRAEVDQFTTLGAKRQTTWAAIGFG